MLKTINLRAHAVYSLTTMDWYQQVVAQLDNPQSHDSALLGVDIAHFLLPRRTASEACAGFVNRSQGITATCRFNDREQKAYDRIDKIVRGGAQPAKSLHMTLAPPNSQVNTLIFKDFTLVYSFNLSFPGATLSTAFMPFLILHRSAAALRAEDLYDNMKAGFDAFIAANEDLAQISLEAPGMAELRSAIATMAA